MKELLKQLILDFHAEPLPEPALREPKLANFSTQVRKAHVIMGMRRTGKTWLLYQHMQNLLSTGYPLQKLLYLNFEDDRLCSFQTENFQDILTAYFDLYPQYAHDEHVIFYFDEIHSITHWEKFIRRLLDKEKMQIYVTGSSAKMLSREIATSLRGRAHATEIFPFSFKEYLSFHKISSALTTKNQSMLRKQAQHYLQWGGFPEILFLQTELYHHLLQDYVNTVVFRDVIDRYRVTNPHVVKLFLLQCLQNPATLLSITKVYNTLKSLGATVSKNSLYDYFDYFSEAYLLYPVPILDFSTRKQQVNPKKIYTIDTGIISAYSVKPDYDHWARLENAVFMELRRKNADIFYYKTKTGQEIDFAVLKSTGALQLYQVCLSLADTQTHAREITALITAAAELKIQELFLITLDEEKTIEQNKHTIHVIPFWKWAGTIEKS